MNGRTVKTLSTKSQKKSGGNWIYPDPQCKGHHICTKYSEQGIRIRLEHAKSQEKTKGYYIRMVVNPKKLINPHSGYLGILPPEEESIELPEKEFAYLFCNTPFENKIRQYYLTRVDLCTNIHCDNKKVFRELVRLLRKTATPKKYERKLYQHNNKKKANQYNKHYIRFACGQQELVIYNKTYQITENNLTVAYEKMSDGVLRIEVHYKRGKLKSLENEYHTDDPLEILWTLIQESQSRILNLVEKCYPDLKYLSLGNAQELVHTSKLGAETKNEC